MLVSSITSVIIDRPKTINLDLMEGSESALPPSVPHLPYIILVSTAVKLHSASAS